MRFKSTITKLLVLFSFALMMTFAFVNVHAAEKDITAASGEATTVTITLGDEGKIVPQFDGDVTAMRYDYYLDNDGVLSIDDQGNYKTLKPGTVFISITGYQGYEAAYNSNVTINVFPDMTNATLETDTVTVYKIPTYIAKNKPYYDALATTMIKLSGDAFINLDDLYGIDDYNANDILKYTSSNKSLKLSVTYEGDKIYILQEAAKAGKAEITVTLYGKEFKINYESVKAGISDQSYLLVKGKSHQIKVTGYKGDVVWKSSKPSVASVDENGKVKGLKTGNCIITAKCGDFYLGCAVSVTSSKLKKVTERATYIGTHWKYSQPKRAVNGYYDCSSLVWRAYHEKAGLTFGTPYYPGNTTTESAWCKKNGKVLSGAMSNKKITGMKLNPGDIMFKSYKKKTKYKTTYHVEMFTGYICTSVEDNGKANYTALWAARGLYYSTYQGYIVARPLK